VVFDLLSIGYKVCFCANGRSMNPTVREGEKIIVAPVAPSQLRVGDIVLYRNHRGVIAHRVVTIEKREGDARVFILRGDASRSCDAPVESRQILGKVVSVERNGWRMNVSSRRAKMARKLRGYVSRIKAWYRSVGIWPV
jgi:signal peptidase